MSLQLWIHSFDWHRLNALRHENLAEMLGTQVECEREESTLHGYASCFEAFPGDSRSLRRELLRMVSSDDWYDCLDPSSWEALDNLIRSAFTVDGFLGSAIQTTPRTNGIGIETADVSCPHHPRRPPAESYRMGHRRYQTKLDRVYPDESDDDPGYSIHDPTQVKQIYDEISGFDYANYPDEWISQNFREDFLQPVQYCCDHGLAILSRWS